MWSKYVIPVFWSCDPSVLVTWSVHTTYHHSTQELHTAYRPWAWGTLPVPCSWRQSSSSSPPACPPPDRRTWSPPSSKVSATIWRGGVQGEVLDVCGWMCASKYLCVWWGCACVYMCECAYPHCARAHTCTPPSSPQCCDILLVYSWCSLCTVCYIPMMSLVHCMLDTHDVPCVLYATYPWCPLCTVCYIPMMSLVYCMLDTHDVPCVLYARYPWCSLCTVCYIPMMSLVYCMLDAHDVPCVLYARYPWCPLCTVC